MINIHSKTSKQKCYIVVITNMNKKGPMRNDIKYIIRQTMSTSNTQCLAPFLKTYKGMKVIIMKKIILTRIVNRSIGYIENISLTYFK
jgi:hypothetical protein